MKKTFLKLLFTALLLAFSTGLAHAQAPLIQTTLASAITIGTSGGASGVNQGVFQTNVSLTSATGVITALNGQPITILYVGNEAMGVLNNAPSTTTTFNVLRGLFGTKTAAHPAGDMVLIEVITPQMGGFSGSGGFQNIDPPYNGQCSPTGILATPWVNMITGGQFLCSSITNTWVKGWGASNWPATVTAAVASAAGLVTPSGPLFHITGTAAITGFNTPIGCDATAVGGCSFTVIPDGAFTWTTANNIAIAGTAVVNVPITFTWDATNSKWVPSYNLVTV